MTRVAHMQIRINKGQAIIKAAEAVMGLTTTIITGEDEEEEEVVIIKKGKFSGANNFRLNE